MTLDGGEITFGLSLESLAYILVNEVNRGEVLWLLTRMADIDAGPYFEWEVIECLFDHLKKCDVASARGLVEQLAASWEEGDPA